MACNHDCDSCGEACESRQQPQQQSSFLEKPNAGTTVKKIVAVVSGKGGVGKSLVTGLCAVAASKAGYKVGVLDADVTGPSVPQMFGIHENATGSELGLFPLLSKSGVRIMSLNLLLEDESGPVVWRGPVISGAVKQFWTDVVWGDLDFLFIDMPPGTGDVPLTVFQSIPVDGILIVTSPQELVTMIVKKAVNMAKMMNVPILGMVENMSYAVCPHCNEKIELFGASRFEKTARENGIEPIMRLPIDPNLAALCDAGEIERAALDLKPLQKLQKSLL